MGDDASCEHGDRGAEVIGYITKRELARLRELTGVETTIHDESQLCVHYPVEHADAAKVDLRFSKGPPNGTREYFIITLDLVDDD